MRGERGSLGVDPPKNGERLVAEGERKVRRLRRLRGRAVGTRSHVCLVLRAEEFGRPRTELVATPVAVSARHEAMSSPSSAESSWRLAWACPAPGGRAS